MYTVKFRNQKHKWSHKTTNIIIPNLDNYEPLKKKFTLWFEK